ncbi:Inner membrane protein YhaI [Marinomonas aquimarina]|uniref:Inner membrane protein YhaI n=1 Tax=Marinomonas aquimarina TaxID=295068 RepID=A0A1A8TAM8_9GAMM|nr:DUF805 domain-containing protein [Marinomonas aquimarina]SBS29631.1 Inner membrane protein YhaI [Marinomonas aquimarina]
MYWYIDALKHYADFRDVAHRRAFWMFMLINLIISVAIIIIELATDHPGWLDALYSIATLIPLIALMTRRLRDTGLPLYSWLVLLIPVIGPLLMLYFLCLPSQPRAQLTTHTGVL